MAHQFVPECLSYRTAADFSGTAGGEMWALWLQDHIPHQIHLCCAAFCSVTMHLLG